MDELYVLARRVLLDALDALGTHRDAIVLVGAQAVYLHVGDAGLAATGIAMATRATGGLVDADELAVSCTFLAGDLLDALKR